MNFRDIIVFDFETGDKDPHTCVPVFLAARVYGARNLQPVPGGEFKSLMRPRDDEWKLLKKDAMDFNKITREQLEAAPDREQAWKSFVAFVNRFNKKPGSPFTAPIPAGMNINGFDLVIIQRLADEYGPVDKQGRQALFNQVFTIDLLPTLFLWYENQNCLPKFSMDTVREHFGLSGEGAHGANMVDVDQEGEMITRFLRLHRRMFERVPGLLGVAAEKEAA